MPEPEAKKADEPKKDESKKDEKKKDGKGKDDDDELSEEDQALMKATTEALDKLIEKGKEAANEMQARHGPSAVFPEACLPNTRRPAQFVATCPLLAGGGRVRPAPAESARTAEV